MLSHHIKQELITLRDNATEHAERAEKELESLERRAERSKREASQLRTNAHEYQQLIDTLAFAPAPAPVDDPKDHHQFGAKSA